MSEYMRRQPTTQEVLDRMDPRDTLFDLSYDGTSAQSASEEKTSGASVDVRRRYLALEAVADSFGYINKANGFEKVHTRGDVRERYVRPHEVARAMQVKSKAEVRRFLDNVAILNAEAALLAAGFDESTVELNSIATKHEILESFGPKTTYDDRAKRLKKINKGI